MPLIQPHNVSEGNSCQPAQITAWAHSKRLSSMRREDFKFDVSDHEV